MNNNHDPATPTSSPPETDARSPRLLWLVAVAGIAIAYSPMWLPRVGNALGVRLESAGPAASILWNVLAVGALVAYILLLERRPLASIGLRKPRAKDLEWALYLFGIVMAWQWVVLTFFPPAPDSGTDTITALPIIVVVGIIISAAVFEEVLYRGYPIERLAELTGRRWIAFAITIPLFVAPHIVFFGPQWLWTAGVGAAALFVLYAVTRNLPACMVLHLCVNLPILIPTIARQLGA